MSKVEHAAYWDVEETARYAWRSADGLTRAEIVVETEVPFSKDGRRLPRFPHNVYYPTLADIRADDEVPFRLILSDDLRSFAALLVQAADRMDELDEDGKPVQVSPGQVGAFDAS